MTERELKSWFCDLDIGYFTSGELNNIKIAIQSEITKVKDKIHNECEYVKYVNSCIPKEWRT